MKEPDLMKQVDELEEQYKDCLISNEEYEQRLSSIMRDYDEWLKRNE